MAKVLGPLAPRRAIGDMLRQARGTRGLDEVAAACMISASKLSRLETAQGIPTARDIRDLVKFFSFSDEEKARLHRWAAAASEKGWWVAFEDALEEDLDAHASYESDAETERAYTIPVFPALLQTKDYMEALIRHYDRSLSDEILKKKVEFRLSRQALLRFRHDREPLHLRAVVHESALHQLVGSPSTMAGQMRRGIEVVEEDEHARLQVLPFDKTPRFSSGCMYAIFAFSDIGNIVTVESHAGMRFLTKAEETLAYRDYFDAISRDALDGPGTVEKLSEALRSWSIR